MTELGTGFTSYGRDRHITSESKIKISFRINRGPPAALMRTVGEYNVGISTSFSNANVPKESI